MPEQAASATREAYRDRLLELMPFDERLVCLDTDTGLFSGADFGEAAPRYVNVGIAEHNLMGLAAGLAASGHVPFVNTMAAFASERALEAVKVDIAYNDLPVRIAATHSGLSAGHLGPTHHALEDLAIMRSLPNMTVVVPADGPQAAALIDQTLDLPDPVYLRLGRKATPDLDDAFGPPELGRIQRLHDGRDVVVVATGPLPVQAALAAVGPLAADGISVAVLNAHTLKPFDVETLREAVEEVKLVVTVEDHWRSGGLGGAVTETLSEWLPRRVVRLGMPDTFAKVAGGHDYLLERYGVHAGTLAERIRCELESDDGADPTTRGRNSGTHVSRV